MNIAVIYPTKIIDNMHNLTNFHMLLPKQIQKLEQDPNEEYRIHALCHPNKFTILDNGVFEGNRLSHDELVKYVQKYDINEIVLPDAFQNQYETLDMLTYLFESGDLPITNHRASKFSYMIVPQGRNAVEWLNNLHDIKRAIPPELRIKNFTIGMPKWLGRDEPTVRANLVEYLNKQGEHLPIHLLGCNSMAEFSAIRNAKVSGKIHFRSIDTSLPAKLAMSGYSLDNASDEEVMWHSHDYITMFPNNAEMDLIDLNVMQFLHYGSVRQYNGL